MTRIFIAYASEDVHHALRMHDELSRLDYPVWLDLNDVPLPKTNGGDGIADLIAEVIDTCSVLIVVHSRNTKLSSGVSRELFGFLGNPLPKIVIGCTMDEANPSWMSTNICGGGDLQQTRVESVDFSRSFHGGLEMLTRLLGEPKPLSTATNGERLLFAIQLALRAGTTALRFFGSAFATNRTIDERANCATLADHAAHREIFRAHSADRRFRNEPLFSEEGDKLAPDSPPPKGFAWIVDPLDGTTNFRAGIQLFCSAVGVLRDGEPFIGAVFDPVPNRLYFAHQGRGAFVWDLAEGRLLRLQRDDRSTGPSLRSCIAGFHLSSNDERRRRLLGAGYLDKAAAQIGNLRAIGSGQLALAYVAAGKLDLFFQLEVNIWDVVAGAVIVRNAGFTEGASGEVRDLQTGTRWLPSSRDILAGSPALAEEFWRLVGSSPPSTATGRP